MLLTPTTTLLIGSVAATVSALPLASPGTRRVPPGCHTWPYFNQTVCWPPEAKTQWGCTPLPTRGSAELAGGAVRWTRQRCTMTSTPPWFTMQPYRQPPTGLPTNMPWNASLWLVQDVTLNVIYANLSAPGVRAFPAVANPDAGTAPLPDIARYANGNTTPGLLAGVNGGYFFRVDLSHFEDDVCIGKTRSDAEQPPSSAHPSDGVGDTLVKVNGRYLSRNCDNRGFSRPAALVLGAGGNGTRIDVLRRGQDLTGSAASANVIAASPNLVTAGRVDIPPDDDNTGNIEEHAANTAVGLRENGTTLVMATVDGIDGCPMANATCGVNAVQLAFLMKDALRVDDAMQMDQGGSTTMWVHGEPNDGVVSVNEWKPRRVFSGLFVAFTPPS